LILLKRNTNFFVKGLINQSNEIEELINGEAVFQHQKALNKKFINDNKKDYRFLNHYDLISSHNYNDVQILIMENTSSLNEYLYFYEQFDLYEFYKLYTLKLACNTDKMIDKRKK